MKVWGVILSVLLIVMAAAVPLSTLANTANGGFEAGTLTGWATNNAATGGLVWIAQQLTAQNSSGTPVAVFNAKEGLYFAVMYPGDPGAYTTLSQSCTVNAGDTISGWALFISEDKMPYNDNGQVLILNSSGAEVSTLFDASVSSLGGVMGASTGWTQWTYTFPTAGTYTVEARVTNGVAPGYPSMLAIDGVTITGTTLPVANAGGHYIVDEGSSVQLNGSGSDPDGGAVTYSWDLNNDGIYDTPGQSVIFSAANIAGPDTRTVNLKVTTGSGASATSSAVVTINNIVPTVNAGQDGTITSGSTFHTNGTFFHPDTTICTATADWGDGSPIATLFTGTPSGGSVPLQVDHPYILPDNVPNQKYTITITVNDGHGGVGTGTVHVNVLKPAGPPTFEPIIAPASVNAGQTVTFDVTAEDPQQLAVTITASGVPAGATVTPSGGIEGTSKYKCTFSWTPQYSDARLAPYRIDFLGTSVSGLTTTANVNILVNPAPPLANAGGPYNIFLGNGVTLDGSASSTIGTGSGITLVKYEWDLNNDGIYEINGKTVSLTAAQLAGYGLNPGTTPVRLRVTDSAGLTGIDTTTLTIVALNVNASAGTGGTITPAGVVVVNYGTNQSFTITPNINYHIADVLVDGVSAGALTSFTFNNVVSNHSISTTFAINTFTINADAADHGSISPSGSLTVNAGTNPVFTVTADTGYHIADVLVDGVSAGAVGTYTFTNVTASHTISASFAINTFTVTATTGDNGTISPAGTLTLNYGSDQTFTITPTPGYFVANVLVDGVSVGSPSSYTFNNINANHTISVSFSLTRTVFTIDASAGSNGAISPSGSIPVEYGSNQTTNITPDAGYHVADVLVDGVSVGAVTSYTFSNVTANHTISASFAINTYAIAATNGVNGTIAPAGTVTVTYGANQTFAITPSAGYSVADVLVDGVSVGAATTYTFSDITANHTIAASFIINTYTITASTGTNGTVSPAGSVTVNYGTNQNFAITTSTGYHVADVLVDGVSVGAVTSYTFSNITANHTIAASFVVNTYTINATSGANGTISPAGIVTVNYGQDQTFAISPAAGYRVANVLVDGVSAGAVNSYTFSNVTANHTIVASFAASTFTIGATAGANGTITPSGTVTVNSGANQIFAITPAAGYRVADVLVDGVSVGVVTSYTFSNITANHTIAASFVANTYTIKASAGANGTITPSGTVTINYGRSQTFAINPNCGYRVADVLVDGVSVGAVTAYTFSNVVANHTISATFTYKNTFTITASAGTNGTISPSGTVIVNYGRSQTFTITPSNGYSVANVLVDGVSVGAVTSYTFRSVNANHTISASFVVSHYTLTVNISGSGTVTKSPDQASYLPGTNVTLTATPAAGWTFSGWQGALSSSATTATLTMDANKTVTALFTNQANSAGSLLIKHLVINWDNNTSHNNDDNDRCNQAQDKYNQYLTCKAKYGDNDKNTQSKYIDYLKSRDNTADNDKTVGSQQDSNNCESAYNQYLQYSKQYGDNDKRTQDKYNDYLNAQGRCKVSCVPPTCASGDFYVYGRMQLPAGMTVADFQRAAVVTLTISNGTVQDSVVFSKGSANSGTMWQYNGNSDLSGVGLNLQDMDLWWAPSTGNYSGMAGFHISGGFTMPAGINGNTQPPQVTVTVDLTKKTGADVRGGATVLCNVSGQGNVWQYSANTGWPSFPYDIQDTGH